MSGEGAKSQLGAPVVNACDAKLAIGLAEDDFDGKDSSVVETWWLNVSRVRITKRASRIPRKECSKIQRCIALYSVKDFRLLLSSRGALTPAGPRSAITPARYSLDTFETF